MQTTAMGTVANSLPQNEIILLTLLISDWYIPYTDLRKKFDFIVMSRLFFSRKELILNTLIFSKSLFY